MSGVRPAPVTVSVVVCAYTMGRWEDLQRAVASVRQQTVAPDEFILVVDHNDELLERARARFPDVSVIPNAAPARGISGARNTGVAAASGEIVVFLDDDAHARPQWLERLLEPYEDRRVLGVGGPILAEWSTARPSWFPEEFDWVVGCSFTGMATQRQPVGRLIGANMSLRRELVGQVGGFDASLGRVGAIPVSGEETALCFRVRHHEPEGELWHEPDAIVSQRVPARRATWAYFRERCYAEGYSKALIKPRLPQSQRLDLERSYVTRTLPRAVARYLGEAARGRPAGVGRAAAVVAGAAITTTGYVLGRGRGLIAGLRDRHRVAAGEVAA